MVHPIQVGKRTRMSFSNVKDVTEMPNLIEVQLNSYQWFLDEGLSEAFEDINPKAKVHVLIVPKNHYKNVAELAASSPETLAHIVEVARNIADDAFHGSFRLIFNTGEDAGQSVFHVHAHVLSGEVLPE